MGNTVGPSAEQAAMSSVSLPTGVSPLQQGVCWESPRGILVVPRDAQLLSEPIHARNLLHIHSYFWFLGFPATASLTKVKLMYQKS